MTLNRVFAYFKQLSKYGELLRVTITFSAVALLSKSLGTISSFLLAGLVTVDVYGQVNTLVGFSYGLGLLMGMGVTAVPFRFCYVRSLTSYRILVKLFVILGVSFLFITFLAGIGLLLNTPLLVQLTDLPDAILASGILVTLCYSVLTIAGAVLSNYYRAQKDLGAFSGLDLLSLIVSFCGGLLFLRVLTPTVGFMAGKSMFLAMYLSVTLVLTHFRSRSLPVIDEFKMPSMGQILKFSVPFMPIALAAWVQSFVDRFVILLSGFSAFDLGIYTMAVQVSGGLYLVLGAVNQSIIPNYITASKSSLHRLLKLLAVFSLGLWILMAIGVFIWSKTDILNDYHGSVAIIMLRSLIIIPAGIQMHYSNIIAYQQERHTFLFGAQICGIVVAMILGLVLAPQYRLYGVTIGVIGGYLVSLVVVVLYYVGLWTKVPPVICVKETGEPLA